MRVDHWLRSILNNMYYYANVYTFISPLTHLGTNIDIDVNLEQLYNYNSQCTYISVFCKTYTNHKSESVSFVLIVKDKRPRFAGVSCNSLTLDMTVCNVTNSVLKVDIKLSTFSLVYLCRFFHAACYRIRRNLVNLLICLFNQTYIFHYSLEIMR